jgi:hypothetical protein
MPGLVPGIHDFLSVGDKDVDGRDKPGHDEANKKTGPERSSIAPSVPLIALVCAAPLG